MGDMGEEILVRALELGCWLGAFLDMDLEAVLGTALVLEEVLVDLDMVDLVMVVVTIMSRTQQRRTQL